MNRVGEVVDGPNKRGEYRLQLGNITLMVAETDLKTEVSQPAKVPRALKAELKGDTGGDSRLVDLHGLAVVEAIEKLEDALDIALRDGAVSLEIIHGIGTGALKTAIAKYCERSTHIKAHKPKERNPGTTIAYL